MSIMPAFTTRRTNYYYRPFSHDASAPVNDEYNFQSAKASKHPSSHQAPGPSYPHDDHQYQHAPPSHRLPLPYSRQHREHEITSFANARVEWKEAPEAYFIRAELPGVKREDVRVLVEDDKLLKISGERQIEKEDMHENWHHVERGRGKFLTAFMLPEDSKAEEVKSSMANGVLTVTVPKKHHIRPFEIIL